MGVVKIWSTTPPSTGTGRVVQYLCGEGGFAMDEKLMACVAGNGNLELVKWLRGKGCPWDWYTCHFAVDEGHVEVLRWARENGAEMKVETAEQAQQKFGYSDDCGNYTVVVPFPGMSW